MHFQSLLILAIATLITAAPSLETRQFVSTCSATTVGMECYILNVSNPSRKGLSRPRLNEYRLRAPFLPQEPAYVSLEARGVMY